MYGNEREVGRAVREHGRDDVVDTTKLLPERVGRERAEIEQSLELLGLEHVDLWLIHWPAGERTVEMWRAFVQA